MAEGFRIGRITVEGFKGFTQPKEIDLRYRHVFLLGRNGNGKSSVIEAIRWGLFGSTGGPNDIVANRGYGGRCRVEMSLARAGKEWRLRRLLTYGAGGGSDAALFDEDGKEHLIRAVQSCRLLNAATVGVEPRRVRVQDAGTCSARALGAGSPSPGGETSGPPGHCQCQGRSRVPVRGRGGGCWEQKADADLVRFRGPERWCGGCRVFCLGSEFSETVLGVGTRAASGTTGCTGRERFARGAE